MKECDKKIIGGKMDTIEISGRLYDEDSIVKEREEYIRLEAVDLCFALKRLVDDKSSLVRVAVARKRIGHEFMVYDECWRVRATVAKYTDKADVLQKMIHDENDFVRYVVVKRGYALESFLDDGDEEIASIARYMLQHKQVA